MVNVRAGIDWERWKTELTKGWNEWRLFPVFFTDHSEIFGGSAFEVASAPFVHHEKGSNVGDHPKYTNGRVHVRTRHVLGRLVVEHCCCCGCGCCCCCCCCCCCYFLFSANDGVKKGKVSYSEFKIQFLPNCQKNEISRFQFLTWFWRRGKKSVWVRWITSRLSWVQMEKNVFSSVGLRSAVHKSPVNK